MPESANDMFDFIVAEAKRQEEERQDGGDEGTNNECRSHGETRRASRQNRPRRRRPP